MTWGQCFIWDIIQRLAPDDEHLNLRLQADVPAGVPVDAVITALGELFERYESLRTMYHELPPGEPRQVLIQSGELAGVIEYSDEAGSRDALQDLIERLAKKRFDLSRDLPVRVGVIADSKTGLPRHVGMAVSHMVADAYGIRILRSELAEAMAGCAGTRVKPRDPGRQPIDQKKQEETREYGRIEESSLGFWEDQLRRFPRSMFAGAALDQAEVPRFWHAVLQAPAFFLAADELGRRYRVSAASVMAAAYTSMLSFRTGRAECALVTRTLDRFASEDRAAVGHFSQRVPIVVSVSPLSLQETARSCQEQSIAAYARGRCNPRKIRQIMDRMADSERDVPVLDTTLNVATAGSRARGIPGEGHYAREEIRTAEAASSFAIIDKRIDEDVAVLLNIFPPHVLTMLVDTRYFNSIHIERAMRAMQRVLVAALEEQSDPFTVMDQMGVVRGREKVPGCGQV
jgi:Condensation domain